MKKMVYLVFLMQITIIPLLAIQSIDFKFGFNVSNVNGENRQKHDSYVGKNFGIAVNER